MWEGFEMEQGRGGRMESAKAQRPEHEVGGLGE